MAVMTCRFFAETLGMATEATVIVPQETRGQIGLSTHVSAGRHPTLYLLHGLSDDHTAWLRWTSIERYVADLGLAVVMPSVHRSFYTDQHVGHRYWTFVSEELPRIMRSFFPLSDRREDTFVVGLSMGGYGALKWALRRPSDLAAAASLSGATDVFARDTSDPEWRATFGDVGTCLREGNDLFALAGDVAGDVARDAVPSGLPALFVACGTEDELYPENVRFRDHCAALDLPLTYEEGPGQHEWGYWDATIQRVLAWLPLGGAPTSVPGVV